MHDTSTKRREAGRLGGLATFRRHGAAHMSRIGKAGFSALAGRFGKSRQLALAYLGRAGTIAPRYLPRRRGEADDRAAGSLYGRFGLEAEPPS